MSVMEMHVAGKNSLFSATIIFS